MNGDSMNGMCLLCLVRTDGKICPGVEPGGRCINNDGPVYDMLPASDEKGQKESEGIDKP